MESRNGELLREAFAAARLRPTVQRRAVLNFLTAHPIHATADEIYAAVNSQDPRVSRATVYNNLKSLMRAGLVREVVSEGTAARFDANLHRHHHFVCDGCGALEDVPWFDLGETAALPMLGCRQVRTFDVVFRGLCQRCGVSSSQEGE